MQPILAQVSPWSILIGAAIAVTVQVIIQVLLPMWRHDQMWEKLTCSTVPDCHADVCSIRVRNGSEYCVKNCWAYISLDYESDDVVSPPPEIANDGGAHFTPGFPGKLSEDFEDRLHWSVGNFPAYVDILSGEKQALRLFRRSNDYIGLFTEVGPLDKGVKYRVLLRTGKSYTGKLGILSSDIPRVDFSISIDCVDPRIKVEIKKLPKV